MIVSLSLPTVTEGIALTTWQQPGLGTIGRMRYLMLGALCAALQGLTACSHTPPAAPLPTVAGVDLARYTGRWYEVAMLPNRFQTQCVADTTAEYRREGERLSVTNRCRNARGEMEEAVGVAEVLPDSGGARLRVSFFRPFWGDYWVLALDPDYRWALVGEPGRRFGWVLSRTPTLPDDELARILARAEALGYTPAAFVKTPQSAAR